MGKTLWGRATFYGYMDLALLQKPFICQGYGPTPPMAIAAIYLGHIP
jgi:hypothetical protein